MREPCLCWVPQGFGVRALPERAPAIGSQTFMRLPWAHAPALQALEQAIQRALVAAAARPIDQPAGSAEPTTNSVTFSASAPAPSTRSRCLPQTPPPSEECDGAGHLASCVTPDWLIPAQAILAGASPD